MLRRWCPGSFGPWKSCNRGANYICQCSLAQGCFHYYFEPINPWRSVQFVLKMIKKWKVPPVIKVLTGGGKVCKKKTGNCIILHKRMIPFIHKIRCGIHAWNTFVIKFEGLLLFLRLSGKNSIYVFMHQTFEFHRGKARRHSHSFVLNGTLQSMNQRDV